MEQSSVLDYLNNTLSQAKGYHTSALGRAQDSRSAYAGALYGNEAQGRSSIVMKDIQRTVNGALPSLVEPFISDEIVQIDAESPIDMAGAKKQEALINYQWSKRNRPLDIMEIVGMNLMVDGTSWVMTGWHKDGYPTIDAVPFESVIPDPAAYTPDDLRFVIYRRKVTMSEILSNPQWYGKHSKESLSVLVPNTSTEYEPEATGGREDTFNPDDRSLEHIELFEYYGWYDMDGDGIAEPVLMIWSDNTLLRADESPYPFGPIPFDCAIYTKIPFSIYGATINDLIGDYQRLRTSLTRGIIDNMANSNNGTKFIRKGSLDAVNMNRLKRGDKYVELNAPAGPQPIDSLIYDGNFNPIPPDVYKMSEDTQKEEENLSGITRYAIGSDSRSLNQMLDIETPIPMADGTFKRLGDIEDGDRLVGSDGMPTTVVKAHEIRFPKSAFRIGFGSGEEIYAGEEHLWTVYMRGMNCELSDYRAPGFPSNWFTIDTEMMYRYFDAVESMSVPRIPAREVEPPLAPSIDPYTLGAWLGDGNSHCAGITAPEECFQWSYADRLELVRGMMDSDGAYHSGSGAIFISNEGEILNGFVRLIESLGWFPHVRLSREKGTRNVINGRIITTTKDYCQVFFTALENPFGIERKASRWQEPASKTYRNGIVSIEQVENSRPMRCLTVDAEDELYCAGKRYTVTHNTATGVGIISSMSQRRLIYLTRHISDMMESVFSKWAALNAQLIEEAVVPTAMGYVEVIGSELPVDSMGIKITTPTEGLKEKRVAELSSMVQSIAPMVGTTGPDIIIGLLAEMAGTMDMPVLKRKLIESTQKEGPAEDIATMKAQIEAQNAQIEMMKGAAQAQKDSASAEKYKSEAEKNRYEVLAHSFGADVDL